MITHVPFPCELEESSTRISHTFFLLPQMLPRSCIIGFPHFRIIGKFVLKINNGLSFDGFEQVSSFTPDALKFFESITIGESPCTFSNWCAFKTF